MKGRTERESTHPNEIQNGSGRMKVIYNLTEALSNMNNVFSFSLYFILDSTSPVVVVVV